MIDDKRRHLPAPGRYPALGQQGQGRTVGAAGDGDGQMRGVLERAKRVHGPGEPTGKAVGGFI